jgi:hypothetical protein
VKAQRHSANDGQQVLLFRRMDCLGAAIAWLSISSGDLPSSIARWHRHATPADPVGGDLRAAFLSHPSLVVGDEEINSAGTTMRRPPTWESYTSGESVIHRAAELSDPKKKSPASRMGRNLAGGAPEGAQRAPSELDVIAADFAVQALATPRVKTWSFAPKQPRNPVEHKRNTRRA